MESPPVLKELDLTLSSSLKYVVAKSASLECLLLEGCLELEAVYIHCPKLVTMTLPFAASLNSLTIKSGELQNLDLRYMNIRELLIEAPNLTTLSGFSSSQFSSFRIIGKPPLQISSSSLQ